MLSDCYEKGHTASLQFGYFRCMKCGQELHNVRVNGVSVFHTQAELDRLWKGVDREAAEGLTQAALEQRRRKHGE